MRIEDCDFLGRPVVVEAPVPISIPGTVLVRTAYSCRWPSPLEREHSLSVLHVLGAGLKQPWRILQHGFRYLVRHERRGIHLALDHHIGAHGRYVKLAHTCFSISGRVEHAFEADRDGILTPGTLVAGFGFKAPPYAPFHVVSSQLLVSVSSERALDTASLLMPAAMMLYGVQRATLRHRAETMVVFGCGVVARLAACFGLQQGARVLLVDRNGTLTRVSTVRPSGSDGLSSTGPPPLLSDLTGAALLVISARTPLEIPTALLAALVDGGQMHGVWIQSGPCLPTPDSETVACPALDTVRIPDPWEGANLDIRSEQPLEVPEWASEPALRRALDWLCVDRDALAGSLQARDFYCPPADRLEHVVPIMRRHRTSTRAGTIGVSFIGAGDFAPFLLKYVLREPNVRLRGVVDLQPARARFVADLYDFEFCSTVAASVLEDDQTDCVFIVTDHHSHAELAASGLRAGKYVFVEKPPAVDDAQLAILMRSVAADNGVLQVGYNRNFAPLVRRLIDLLGHADGPTRIHIRRRPYDVPPNSWYYWPKEGTRIVSNVCHFLDLAHQIAGRPLPQRVTAVHGAAGRPDENAVVAVTFADGSAARVRFSKACDEHELVSVHRGGLTLRLRNYARLDACENGRRIGEWCQAPDFGHAAEIDDFIRGVRDSRRRFYTLERLAVTSRITFAARAALETNGTVDVDRERVLRGVRADAEYPEDYAPTARA